jgi:archaellum component FlaG (FlaF/FlaG flagellin family)
MDKVLSTILLMVAAVVCVTLVINAVYPAITSSTGALGSASARMNERMRSQIEMIHASGELDESESWQDTNSNGYFDVFVWVKNVGAEPVVDVERCDVFLAGNQTAWAWIPHADYAEGAYPQWDYVIENGSTWSTAVSVRMEISYESPLASGEYRAKLLIPNGVSDEYFFSM